VQKPLATVVIATLLTLVVLPVLYKRYALTDATLQEITRKERSEFATSADRVLSSCCWDLFVTTQGLAGGPPLNLP